MISEDLARTGWQFVQGPKPPCRYQVFGERSSGTNFVKRLIGRNSSLKPMEDLGWKHGFPHMTAIPADTIIVACVRDARAWSLSMHAKPWHCPPAMQSLPYSEFIRAEWATIADRKRYFPQVQALGGEGRPLQHDRHPVTGLPFSNLFHLRRTKLEALVSFFQRETALVLCRMEAVQAAPEEFLAQLHAGFGIAEEDRAYRPVMKRLGSKFLASVDSRPDTPSDVPVSDMAFLRSELDLDLEARLGYEYDALAD